MLTSLRRTITPIDAEAACHGSQARVGAARDVDRAVDDDVLDVEPYEPPWWLRNGHLQSLWSYYAKPHLPAYRRERLETHDDDFLDVDWIDGGEEQPLVVACHGLEGCSGSGYMRRLMHAVAARRWNGLAPNYRGCSGEDNRRVYAYHSGWTVDLDFVVRTLTARHPERLILLAGYSLGASIVGNWLGRRATEVPRQVRGAFLCSAPFYLMPCSARMERGFSRIYQRHFVRSLRRKALAKARHHPGAFSRGAVKRARSLRQFDAAFTCPISGFHSVEDYYRQASCGPHLRHIRVPTFILNAADDPLIPAHGAPPEAVSGNPAVRFVRTRVGGHVGFVARQAGWLERQIMAWFEACLHRS
jgi:predicted alpha/beta-fold hydrolase